jgi:hypothetical protein
LIIVHREKDFEEEWQLNWNEETHGDSVIDNGIIEPETRAFGPLNGFQSLRRLEATVFNLVGPVPRAIFEDGHAAVLEKKASTKVAACGKLTDVIGGAGVMEL